MLPTAIVLHPKLEAVYVGLGSEADFIGRDVGGKAVFTYSILGAPSENAWRLAAAKGAAVVFDAQMLPGNVRYQAYPSGTNIPALWFPTCRRLWSGARCQALRTRPFN